MDGREEVTLGEMSEGEKRGEVEEVERVGLRVGDHIVTFFWRGWREREGVGDGVGGWMDGAWGGKVFFFLARDERAWTGAYCRWAGRRDGRGGPCWGKWMEAGIREGLQGRSFVGRHRFSSAHITNLGFTVARSSCFSMPRGLPTLGRT